MRTAVHFKYLLAILSGFAVLSCEKDRIEIFDQSPDERLNSRINEYVTILSGHSQGWLLSVNTDVEGGFNHWVRFDDKNRVDMLSDVELFDSRYTNSSTDKHESSYSVKALQNIVLAFNTYNYLHILADPQEDVNGGKNGDGLKSDFEFSFMESSENGMIRLKGRYNKAEARLTPCSQEEMDAIENGGLKKISEDFQTLRNTIKYPAIEYKSRKADLNFSSRKVSLSYIDDDDELVDETAGGYLDLQGLSENKPASDLHLFKPLDFNDGEITGLSYTDGGFFAVVNGEKVPVFDNKKPTIPLRLGYDRDYNKLRVNPSLMVGTAGGPFLEDYNYCKDYFKKMGFDVQYIHLAFIMYEGRPVMQMSIVYKYGKSLYSILYIYDYEFNEDGTITFTDRNWKTGNKAAQQFESFFRKLVDAFCTIEYEKFNAYDPALCIIKAKHPKTFRIDWIENNTEGLEDALGGFISIDNPEYICPGILMK